MTFANPHPERSSPERADAARAAGEASAAETVGGAFDEILRETSQSVLSWEPLGPEDRRDLIETARRLRGRDLPLETIAGELLFVVLNRKFSALPQSDGMERTIAERVARTLIDDPGAKARLESLWDRLQRSTA